MTPAEIELQRAYDVWGASCGPAALAAALGLPIDDVREAVSDRVDGELVFRGYMNITQMSDAIVRMGATIRWKHTNAEGMHELPSSGPFVVCIQWTGPWEKIPRVAATKRHWIAVRSPGPQVYDINFPEWISLGTWQDEIASELLPKRATGWRCSWIAEVAR